MNVCLTLTRTLCRTYVNTSIHDVTEHWCEVRGMDRSGGGIVKQRQPIKLRDRTLLDENSSHKVDVTISEDDHVIV